MPSMRHLVSLLLSVLLAGCGPQLRPTPERTSLDLSGHWRLPDGEHEALTNRLRTVIEQSQHRDDERERRQMRRETGEQGGMPDQGEMPPSPEGRAVMSGRNWMMRDRREQTDLLLATVVPVAVLHITQHALDDIQIQPEGGAVRRLDTRDGSTLVNKLATLRIQSGWQNDTFVVYARDATQGLQIVERYQHVADQLKLQVQFKMSGIKEQILDTTYSLQR